MKVDVAIIGGGPGGSTISMFLAQQGISTAIVEKELFPRYHIGESMTGECGAVVRALGMEEKMDDADNVVVKHGLTVYSTEGKNSWYVGVQGRDENGNLFPQTTWQVRRDHFDKMLLDEAVARGATLVHGVATYPLCDDDGAVCGVNVRLADGSTMDIESQVLVDASGQATFLANANANTGSAVTSAKYRGNYDKQIAMFSQVAGAIRDHGPAQGDTLIFYRGKYHWAWFIPIDRDVVSVGVVAPAAYFLSKKESKPDYLARELHELSPELKRRIPDVKFTEEVRAIPNYSYQIKRFTGKGFMCIGDAHRFVDPIFSFGLFTTMKEAQLGAAAIGDYLNGLNRDAENPFAEHQNLVDAGADIFEDIIDLFWEHPLLFARYIHQKHPEDMIDILAGRVFEGQPNPALLGARKILQRSRSADVSAAPQGSRFRLADDDPLRRRRNWDAASSYAVDTSKLET